MNSRRQPQRLPPPIDYGAETLEAVEILDEVPSDLGLLLWKSARTTRLWARLSPADRVEAFGSDAFERRIALLQETAVDASLRGELETIASILRGDPGDPRDVAAACRRVAEWAQRESKLGTAVEFMQAAAFADPSDGQLARAVGMLTRQRAEHARAETWFRHAIARARRARDWPIFVRSYLGLGNVHMLRGNYPAARKASLRALNTAKRYCSREIAAMAYHDLAVIAIRSDRLGDAMRYAGAALEAYGPGHGVLPGLAHDIAVYWMKRGHFQEALQVFQAEPEDWGTAFNQLMRVAAIARAAGAVGDHRAYAAAVQDALRLVPHPVAEQGVATALLNVARGAESIGETTRALELAKRAHKIATERGESEIAFAAEALLQLLQRAPLSEERAAEPLKQAPRPVRHLAYALTAALPEPAGR